MIGDDASTRRELVLLHFLAAARAISRLLRGRRLAAEESVDVDGGLELFREYGQLALIEPQAPARDAVVDLDLLALDGDERDLTDRTIHLVFRCADYCTVLNPEPRTQRQKRCCFKPETKNQKAEKVTRGRQNSARDVYSFLVSGFWFLVSGFWFLVSGFWFLVS